MARDEGTSTQTKGVGAKAAASGRKVLFSAMKNEAPFILEWAAYHLVIGFDRIIVFSNDSDDGTTELLNALDEADIIEHHIHSPGKGVSAQGHAAGLANSLNLIENGDWVLWLDADEFLNIRIGDGVLDDLLDLLGDKKGMTIQWRLFGDSGNKHFPGRFISDRFRRASYAGQAFNREIKMMFLNGPEFVGLSTNGINRPRLAKNAGLTCDDFLNSNGTTLTPSHVNDQWLNGIDHGRTRHVMRSDIGNPVAQINHYSVRTPEYFLLKRTRGRGWAPNQMGAANKRHTPNFYNAMNRNGLSDSSILRHQSNVTEGIDGFLSIPAVSRANNVALRRTKTALLRSQGHKAATDYLASLDTPAKRFGVTLPAAETTAVQHHYGAANIILEYGSGGSSFVAMEKGAQYLMAVECDPVWAVSIDRSMQAHFPDGNFDIHFVDIGPVGAWGRPTDASGYATYHQYALSPWQQPHFQHPDVVLIDGRFRVSCFWATVMNITKPVTVLFDDYLDRPEYHWVEQIVPRVETIGRMARFELAPGINYQSHLVDIIGSFTDAR